MAARGLPLPGHRRPAAADHPHAAAVCAARQVATSDQQAIERYDETYLINKFYSGDDRVRLLPTDEDRKAFRRWVLREPDNNAGDDISRAYRFFAARLNAEDATGLDLEVLTHVVVERLEIVLIHTQQGDNAHRIFQSLNGTGVRLNQADLLRNYLFMLLPTRAERRLQRRVAPDGAAHRRRQPRRPRPSRSAASRLGCRQGRRLRAPPDSHRPDRP